MAKEDTRSRLMDCFIILSLMRQMHTEIGAFFFLNSVDEEVLVESKLAVKALYRNESFGESSMAGAISK